MEKVRYRRVKIKSKFEYVWDPEGEYIRQRNKFIVDKSTSAETKLLKEFNALVKGYPYVKQRVKNIKNVEKKIYYAKVWILTELNNLTTLKNHEKRGFKKYHLDHIYPISEGFNNEIPPEIISDIENLRFITRKTNMKKGNTITRKGAEIIKKLLK